MESLSTREILMVFGGLAGLLTLAWQIVVQVMARRAVARQDNATVQIEQIKDSGLRSVLTILNEQIKTYSHQLEACEIKHGECEKRQDELQKRVDRLESRDAMTAINLQIFQQRDNILQAHIRHNQGTVVPWLPELQAVSPFADVPDPMKPSV